MEREYQVLYYYRETWIRSHWPTKQPDSAQHSVFPSNQRSRLIETIRTAELCTLDHASWTASLQGRAPYLRPAGEMHTCIGRITRRRASGTVPALHKRVNAISSTYEKSFTGNQEVSVALWLHCWFDIVQASCIPVRT